MNKKELKNLNTDHSNDFWAKLSVFIENIFPKKKPELRKCDFCSQTSTEYVYMWNNARHYYCPKHKSKAFALAIKNGVRNQ